MPPEDRSLTAYVPSTELRGLLTRPTISIDKHVRLHKSYLNTPDHYYSYIDGPQVPWAVG